MKLEDIIIRKATMFDVDQITKIKVYGFKAAYEGIVDQDYLDNINVYNEIEKYTNNYYSVDDVFVAELDDRIVGFCRIVNYDESPYDDKKIDCEIKEMYVRPDIKGMGIGSKLFNYVLKEFKRKRKNKLYLGVFQKSYKSRKFYKKMGGTLGKKGTMKVNGKPYTIVSYTYKLK